MKLSIITINKDNISGLKRTIDSVSEQSFTDFEWIVIDGCSTDGSRELIEKHSDKFSFWVSEPDKGIYDAMNKGSKKAQGDYLLFLNSGDWLYSQKTLEKVFSRKCEEDIIYGDYAKVGVDSSVEKVRSVDEVTFFGLSNYSICHNATFIKKDMMLRFPYDTSLKIVADWKFFMQVLMSDGTFIHIKEYISYIDMNGISNNNLEQHAIEREKVLNDICPGYLKRELKRIKQITTAESFLANTPLDTFVEIRQKYPLIGKAITLLILLMRRLAK